MNFQFMVDEDMIRPDQYHTIGRYLEWGRAHMLHSGIHGDISDGSDAFSAFTYWGYRGRVPAARVIDPIPTTYNDLLSSWVIGCPSMSKFTQTLLRAVNIPVQTSVGNVGQTGHTVPLFWTAGYTMSHGDDVYAARYYKSTPPFPADKMLIPMSTFNNWFYGNEQLGPAGSANVGRQVEIEIPLQYLPDVLVQAYCADKAASKTHANGAVAAFFRNDDYNVTFYTPAQLEAKNLWSKLAVRAAALGLCTP